MGGSRSNRHQHAPGKARQEVMEPNSLYPCLFWLMVSCSCIISLRLATRLQRADKPHTASQLSTISQSLEPSNHWWTLTPTFHAHSHCQHHSLRTRVPSSILVTSDTAKALSITHLKRSKKTSRSWLIGRQRQQWSSP